MLSIRNAYTDVFARGDRKTIVASDEKGYDIVSRSYKGTKLYVGLNIKDVAQTVEIPVSENNGTVLKDLYSGKTYCFYSPYQDGPETLRGGGDLGFRVRAKSTRKKRKKKLSETA